MLHPCLTFDIYLAKISKSGLQQIAATNMQRDTENYLLYYNVKVCVTFFVTSLILLDEICI